MTQKRYGDDLRKIRRTFGKSWRNFQGFLRRCSREAQGDFRGEFFIDTGRFSSRLGSLHMCKGAYPVLQPFSMSLIANLHVS
jgi:hypothetical protein